MGGRFPGDGATEGEGHPLQGRARRRGGGAAGVGGAGDSASGETGGGPGAPAPAPRPPPPAPPAPRPRPTHFLAVRLSHDAAVVAGLGRVHGALLARDPRLAPLLVDPAAAHLTLGVLTLGEGDVAPAAAHLSSAAGRLGGPLEVRLAGLDSFGDRVLFVGVAPGPGRDRLEELCWALRAHVAAGPGGGTLGPETFAPHLTVAKASQGPRWGGRGGRRGGRGGPGARPGPAGDVDPGAGAGGEARGEAGLPPPAGVARRAWEGLDFPERAVAVAEVELLAMRGREQGGYYPRVAAVGL